MFHTRLITLSISSFLFFILSSYQLRKKPNSNAKPVLEKFDMQHIRYLTGVVTDFSEDFLKYGE